MDGMRYQGVVVIGRSNVRVNGGKVQLVSVAAISGHPLVLPTVQQEV